MHVLYQILAARHLSVIFRYVRPMYIGVISPMISNLQTHAEQFRGRTSLHLYMMAANAGEIKAIVSFYHVNSDTVFERHRSRVPINDLNTVHALKKHLIRFLGLKELTIKYGPGDFDMKLYRMAPKPVGKSDNFAITTDDRWKLEFPSMLYDSGSEMNSMYISLVLVYLFHVVV